MQKTDATYQQGVMPDSAASIVIKGVSTDTRSIAQGDLFIALVGPNFNGHDYINKAIEKGAAAIIVSEPSDTYTIPALLVSDTRLALGLLGAAVKQKLSPKTIAITGSSGKTTVKEMVNAILSTRGKVLATKGNFNNDIGVPLTLLNLNESHDYAVIEMGANHQGEIDYTCGLVKPDVATIINAAPAHIEGFGSLFGVARAKSEIIKGLQPQAVAILNHDSQFFEFWQGKSGTQQILTFSYESNKGDFHANKVSINSEGCAEFELMTPIGTAAIKLRVPGVHNVGNAVLSAALAISAGANLANVQQGLFNMQSVAGRLAVKQLTPSIKVLDDTYNANVGSVKAAIDLLANFDGFRVFVFGDMGELGDQASMYHEQIGEYALAHNIDALISCGPLSVHASFAMQDKGMACKSTQSSFEALIKLIGPLVTRSSAILAGNDRNATGVKNTSAHTEQNIPVTILIKGSRSARMEQVVEALVAFDFSHGDDNSLSNNKEPA
ncbi:MAG: UDP-N-acetylmuramoyl-tripeptide--D-alanyl-D-alanine ligase [Alphaproteobacteria bacterium]|jgi:UDP-N-acetylmuramoyl-tripeptide--D-alanyl-D-alanine ligase